MDARPVNLKCRFLLKQTDFILKPNEINLLKFLASHHPTPEQFNFFNDISNRYLLSKTNAIRKANDDIEAFINLGIK